MKLQKFLNMMAIVTVLSLVYINMQMKIIELAYQGKVKEKKIRELVEQNGNITHDVLTLKSANHLGVHMLSDESDMKFVDPDNIVKISTPPVLSEEISRIQAQEAQKRSNPLLSFLSRSVQSEAWAHK